MSILIKVCKIPKSPLKILEMISNPPETTGNCLDTPTNTEKALYPRKNEGPTPPLNVFDTFPKSKL